MPFAFQIGSSASQDQLEKLIAQRLQGGADKAAIDARICRRSSNRSGCSCR